MLDPTTDIVFRSLFSGEANEDVLIFVINAVLQSEKPIVSVRIKNPFNLAEYKKAKLSILDIKAVDSEGRLIDIEMQLLHHRLYGRRALYYLANEYVGQLEAKDNYTKLNTAIGIHFLDFAYFDDDRYRHHFVFKDIEDNLMPAALDGMQLYFIEMPKFRKDWPEVSTDLERLVAFLKGAEKLDPARLPSQILEEPALLKAVNQLERMGMDKEQRSIYESEVKRRMVDTIQLESAREDGKVEGRQEGRQEGRKEGMQHLILIMLHQIFPDIPGATVAKLEALDSEALDDLSAALFGFHTVDDVEGWLANR